MVSAWLIIICKGLIIAFLHCFKTYARFGSKWGLYHKMQMADEEVTSASGAVVEDM